MNHEFKLWAEGSMEARERILTKYYDELKSLARIQLRRQKRTASLDTTDLQHVMMGKILGSDVVAPKDRSQLMGLAAVVMRRALIDLARSKASQKRDAVLVEWNDEAERSRFSARSVLDIHNALLRLKAINPRQHDIVELKVFGGLSNQDVALALDMKLYKVKELWEAAKNWMRVVLENEF